MPAKAASDPQHAVQLDRMAAGLVDLEGHLVAGEDDGGAEVLGARLRREERHRLLRDPRGVADQVLLHHELPAAGVLVAAAGVRVGAALHLAVPHRLGLDAAPGLVEGLLDVRALARAEQLPLAPDLGRGAGGPEALDRPHGRLGAEQQVDALAEGHRERVDLDRRPVAPPLRGHRGQPDVGLLDEGGGPGEGHGLGGDAVRLGGAQDLRGGEPPGAVGDRAHAEARRVRPGDRVEVAVPDQEVLGLALDEPRVGVARPADRRRVEGAGEPGRGSGVRERRPARRGPGRWRSAPWTPEGAARTTGRPRSASTTSAVPSTRRSLR